VGGDVEALLGAGEDAGGNLVADELAEDIFESAVVELEVFGEAGGELDDAVVEEGGTDLEGVGHGHAVALVEDVVGEIEGLVEPEVAVEGADGRAFRGEAAVEVGGGTVGDVGGEGLFFGEGVCAVPEEVGVFGGLEGAGEEAFGFVFEADLVVGGGPEVEQGEGGAAEQGGDGAGASGVGIGEIGLVAGEEFVGALAAEGDGDVAAGHAGEEPDGEGAGVGAGFVGIVGEIVDGLDEAGGGVDVELVVIGGVDAGDFAEPGGFVEAAAGEGDGEGFEALGGGLGGVVEDGGGIEPTRGPDAEGDIGDELFGDAREEEGVELGLGVVERDGVVGLEFEIPIGLLCEAALAPVEEAAGAELSDAGDEGMGLGDVVEREVVGKGFGVEVAEDGGVVEEDLEFGAEDELLLVLVVVKRFDADAVADEEEFLEAEVPDGEGEHAAEFFEAGGAPLAVGLEDDFGVAVGAEAVAEGGEFVTEGGEVIDLAVEDDDGLAVFGEDGLVAAGKVDDFEADGAEGEGGIGPGALLVGAAVGDGAGHRLDAAGFSVLAEVGVAGDSAHFYSVAGAGWIG